MSLRIEDLPERYRKMVLDQIAQGGSKIPPVAKPKPVIPQNPKPRSGSPKRRTTGIRQPNSNEKAFKAWLERECEQFKGKLQYEALTFKLPGGSKYTPDWVYFHPNGGIHCFEVKGSYKLGSHGRALLAFREARAAFPTVTFQWFTQQRGGGYLHEYPEDPTDNSEAE